MFGLLMSLVELFDTDLWDDDDDFDDDYDEEEE